MQEHCITSPLLCFSAKERAQLQESSGCACLKTLYTAAQARLNLPLEPFDAALHTLEAVQLSKAQLSPEDVFVFIRRLNLQHAIWHLLPWCIADAVEVLSRHLRTHNVPWMVYAPMQDDWRLILGVRDWEVLVFEPTAHTEPVELAIEDLDRVAVWRSLTDCIAEWGNDITPTQAMMILPQPVPPLANDVQEREETYTFLMMSQPTSVGASASKKDREALGLVESWNFVYGEITFAAMAEMLQFVGKVSTVMCKPDCKFVDLGSGAGKAVIAAALIHPFEVCEGVELLQSVHTLSLTILEEFDEQIRPSMPNDTVARSVRFANEDILKHDWADADVVLLHWTTFTPDVVAAITAAATKLKPGSVVITVSQPLLLHEPTAIAANEQHTFRVVFEQFHTFSWGETIVYYQVRTDVPAHAVPPKVPPSNSEASR